MTSSMRAASSPQRRVLFSVPITYYTINVSYHFRPFPYITFYFRDEIISGPVAFYVSRGDARHRGARGLARDQNGKTKKIQTRETTK